jgi:restriction system protein
VASKEDLPAYPEYVAPALRAFRERGGSATIEEMEEGVAEIMALGSDLLAVPHGDGPRTQFQYELAWVRTYLKKVGALTNSERGIWSLTEVGERMTDEEARQVFYRVRTEAQKARRTRAEAGVKAGLSVSEVEVEETEQSWVDRLLEILGRMDPTAFERLCQRLLRESGFIKVDVTGRAGDGGIDGIGVLRMNLVSFQVLFQCKRWKGSVGASVVRDFRGAMVGRADKGLIIATGTFTTDARREATRDGAPAIDLIDGEMLCQLLKERQLGVSIRMVEQIEPIEAFFMAV